jgi:hypothetical protein
MGIAGHCHTYYSQQLNDANRVSATLVSVNAGNSYYKKQVRMPFIAALLTVR